MELADRLLDDLIPAARRVARERGLRAERLGSSSRCR